jgi:hypothetical protein
LSAGIYRSDPIWERESVIPNAKKMISVIIIIFLLLMIYVGLNDENPPIVRIITDWQ